MTKHELAKLDNPADCTIQLAISGNRLVSICNALQQMLYETQRVIPHGEEWDYASPWFAELNDTVEAIRDELSAQRMAASHV